MEISITELADLERRMTVVVPATRVEDELEARLKKLARTLNLKGFRPGKVPYDVVKRQFGESVYREVVHELVDKTLHEALSNQPFTVAGHPRVTTKPRQPTEPLSYEAIFEIYPAIELHDLQGAKIEKLKSEVTAQDVDTVIEKLRKHAVTWQAVERPAEQGDRLIIDFVGTCEGKELEGGSAKDFALVLGSGTMIPGFEDGLLGSQAGRQVNLTLTFPENYLHKDLAGKAAAFQVTVQKVAEPILPELDEAFAQTLGITEGGVEKLREEVRQNIEREIAQIIQNDLRNKVWEEWLRRNTFEVPKSLIDLEISRLQRQFKQRFAGRTDISKIPDLPPEQFEAEAKRRVRLGLLLNALVKQEQLKVASDALEAKINQLAANHDHPAEVANWIRNNKEQQLEIEALLLEEQAITKLLENAEVYEQFKDCQALIKLNEGSNA